MLDGCVRSLLDERAAAKQAKQEAKDVARAERQAAREVARAEREAARAERKESRVAKRRKRSKKTEAEGGDGVPDADAPQRALPQVRPPPRAWVPGTMPGPTDRSVDQRMAMSAAMHCQKREHKRVRGELAKLEVTFRVAPPAAARNLSPGTADAPRALQEAARDAEAAAASAL